MPMNVLNVQTKGTAAAGGQQIVEMLASFGIPIQRHRYSSIDCSADLEQLLIAKTPVSVMTRASA